MNINVSSFYNNNITLIIYKVNVFNIHVLSITLRVFI